MGGGGGYRGKGLGVKKGEALVYTQDHQDEMARDRLGVGGGV